MRTARLSHACHDQQQIISCKKIIYTKICSQESSAEAKFTQSHTNLRKTHYLLKLMAMMSLNTSHSWKLMCYYIVTDIICCITLIVQINLQCHNIYDISTSTYTFRLIGFTEVWLTVCSRNSSISLYWWLWLYQHI